MKLNIGSGEVGGCPELVNNWINVDFRYDASQPQWKDAKYLGFDLSKEFPIERDSVDCIFASHTLEHFNYNEIYNILRECYKVLKPGHPIRIICPDPRKFIANWQAGNKQYLYDCYGKENYDTWLYERYPNIGFTDMFFHDHYDHYICPAIDFVMIFMIRIGFTKVVEVGCANTMFPEYFKISGEDISVFDNRPCMSYYLEGTK